MEFETDGRVDWLAAAGAALGVAAIMLLLWLLAGCPWPVFPWLS